MQPLLSLCMIVKNEAPHLPRCLESVRGLADEVIVVDTGSTDGTPEVARQHGAKVLPTPWEDDFSAARNRSLEAATGRWILVLDADEFLLERDRRAIAERIASGAQAGYGLLQRSALRGAPSGMLVSIVRLFPNRPDVRYEWPIHEQVVTALQRAALPVIPTPIEIQHTGYADPAVNQEKQRRNVRLLQAQVAKPDPHPVLLFLLGGALLDLGEIEPALASYERARQSRGAGLDIRLGAVVRCLTCLVRLKRWSDALELASQESRADFHPEFLLHRGEAESALGRIEAARASHEQVFALPDRAYIPPCSLDLQKIGALVWLGGYWRSRGQPQLGLTLLRAGNAIHQSGLAFGRTELTQLYASFGVGAAAP